MEQLQPQEQAMGEPQEQAMREQPQEKLVEEQEIIVEPQENVVEEQVIIVEPQEKVIEERVNIAPQEKRMKLTQSSPNSKSKRYVDFVSDDKVAELAKGKKSINTSRNTTWAVNVFTEWSKVRNRQFPDNQIPEGFVDQHFNSDRIEDMCYWLSRFIAEARNSEGKRYSPTSLHGLLCGLLRHMRGNNPETPNFLDKKDLRFRRIHGTMESVFSSLRQDGIGAEVKHTPIITPGEEERLWATGILGTDNPIKLQRAVFYYIGKIFCIHGGQEQRSMKPSQFQWKFDPDQYIYIENGSKNNSGARLKVQNKDVPMYANPEAGERCFVRLLDLYLAKLPPFAFENDILYLRPKANIAQDGTPWYYCAPVGKEKLRTMVRGMCAAAGISEKKTNHSLRATGATCLFAANVPEKLIQGRTGHQTVKALRMYERPSQEQHQAVSNILLNNEQGREFGTEVNRNTAVVRDKRTLECQQTSAQKFLPTALFENMVNCCVNFTPQNFVVNISNHGTASTVQDSLSVEKEFDKLVENVSMEGLQ